MNVRIVSLYSLVFILLGRKYKISFCNAASTVDIYLDQGSKVKSQTIQLVPLELDNRVTTDYVKYRQNGTNGNLFTALGDNRFNQVTSEGQIVWAATKNEYPDRVYYEVRGDKPLLQLIYSDEEFKLPKAAADDDSASMRSGRAGHVRKTAGGQEYVQLPLPKSGDDTASVRSSTAGSVRAKPITRRAVPLRATVKKAGGQEYADYAMPRTDTEDAGGHVAQPKSVKVRASPVAASHALPVSKGSENYIQMPMPKSGAENAPITPQMTQVPYCAPCVSQGQGYQQVPMPKTDNEGDTASVRSGSVMNAFSVQAPHAFGHAARPPDGGFSVAHASPVRTGVEDGQAFLEYKMPRTDNEGAGGVAGQDYLEFKLGPSGSEHSKATTPVSGALPKRKAITSDKYQDFAMPKTGESGAESDFDIENDEEIQFLLRFIEDMKQKLAELRELLRQMDEAEAGAAGDPQAL